MPKKPTKPKKNPTDPLLLAREVVEAAIGGPLSTHPKETKKEKTPKRKKTKK